MSDCTAVVKLALKADNNAAAILDGQSKICNWLYNRLLEQANILKQEFIQNQSQTASKIVYTKRGLRNQVPGLKKEKSFLKSVHSSPLKNAALTLSKAIRFYQDVKKGKRPGNAGWPQFRSFKQKFFSLFYDEPNKGFLVNGNQLQLSLGVDQDQKRLKLVLSIKEVYLLKDKHIKNLRITKESGTFFAIFSIKKDLPKPKLLKRILSLDPNHKNLAYGVCNEKKAIEINNPSFLKKFDKRIDELKSKRDRCQRKSQKIAKKAGGFYYQASKRYLRYDLALKKAYQKRREQTKIFLFTLANRLYKEYDMIAVGDYTPSGGGITKGMRRSMNNRSLIGRFKKTLQWIALKSGKGFMEWNEKGSTRTCHACGYVVENGLAPSIREWECAKCDTVHIRDENAAINGLRRVQNDNKEKISEFFEKVPSSGPVRVIERSAWWVLPSGVCCTSRGQSRLKANHQEIKMGKWYSPIQAVQI